MALNEQIVDRWLDRGQRFIRGVTRNGTIRAALLARGLSEAELLHGWTLYSAVLGVSAPAPTAAPASSNLAAEAMAQVDDWDAPNFETAHAVLIHRAPAAAQFLFFQLNASAGPNAIVAVQTFLDRREELKKGTAAGVAPDEATLAVELLASRRIVDDTIAEHLRGLILRAKQGGTAPTVVAREVDEATFERYRSWLNEWREVARSTFTRRDYLIALGLAARRSGEDEPMGPPKTT